MKTFQNIPKHKQSIMLNYLFVLPIPSIIARLSNLVKGGCIKNTEFNEEYHLKINTLGFFNKLPVCKQLALGKQIAKQLSGLNPLSLLSNKNYR